MKKNELTELSIFEASDLLKKRAVTPLELVEACLTRIDSIDQDINSFITLTPEPAIKAARQAEKTFYKAKESNGGSINPLYGIPIGYKDLYETAGIPTTAGSSFFKNNCPELDSRVVEYLKKTGAISLGKLNMHEIALGVTNVNPHYGACRNPWAPERIPGGSSGGSAAALAAGLIYGSMGSDTGGSIRIPSALCGTVGLKPTRGRISLRGVIPLSWTLDHAGPMARCVMDAAALYDCTKGYDPDDPFSINPPQFQTSGQLSEGIKNWRVGIASDEYFSRVDPEVSQAVSQAGNVFSELGAIVESIPFPGAQEAAEINGLITACEAAAFHHQRLKDAPEGFGPDVLTRLQTGSGYSSREYINARNIQAGLTRKFEQFFEKFEILLTPTTPVAAPLIVGPDAVEQARLLTRFTAPFNLSGLPAISIPCGNTGAGLPIGLQIAAGKWKEREILRAAYAYEQACGWYTMLPLSL